MTLQQTRDVWLADQAVISRLIDGDPTLCSPGSVERRFGVIGCQAGVHRWTVMRTASWWGGVDSTAQVGAVGVLLDHALGEAVFVARPRGYWSVTTELTLDVLTPPPWNSPQLLAQSWMMRPESSGGYAQGRMFDRAGNLLAVASTWARYVPYLPPPAAEPAYTSPPLASAVSHSLQDLLGYQIDGENVVLRDAEQWNNDYGVLHGGVWAALVDVASARALTPSKLTTTQMHLSYLRPPAPGQPVLVQADDRHVGRSFGEVGVIGVDGAGRICVSATVTGRPS